MLCVRHLRVLERQLLAGHGSRLLSSTTTGDSSRQMKQLSQFQERKMLHEFDNVYDRNRDGYICREDIDDLKNALKTYYARNHGSALEDTHINKYENYWKLFTELADSNKDGKLSRIEWLAMWAHINDQALDISFMSLPMWVRLMPASLFPAMDIKRDGVIDFEEYQHFWYYLAQFDTKYTKVKTMFNIMTEEGKLAIDEPRFELLYADFYLSADPSSPGKYVAGPADFSDSCVQ